MSVLAWLGLALASVAASGACGLCCWIALCRIVQLIDDLR